MTAIRGLTLLLCLGLAGVLVDAAGPPAASPSFTGVRLTAIRARAHDQGASLVIETTAPVPYVTTSPDPMTVLVDFRNVVADGVANSVAADAKASIANVAVEATDAMGTPASRVRITLARPLAHHVRSDRNTVVVDFEKTSGSAASAVRLPVSREAADPIAALDRPDASDADPIAALGLDGSGQRGAAAARTLKRDDAVQTRPAATAQAQPPAPALPAPAEPPQQARGAERRFTGHPVSFDFQGADLRAVLRTFAEISGLNIVIDPTVQGSVDVSLRDVPWDQALDIILRANKLGYSVEGTIVRVAPLAVLASEEKDRSELAKAQAEAGEIQTLTRQLSYAKGDEIVNLLKQANVLSPRGQAFVDARTNTLIVTDLAARLTATTDLVNALDKPQPQVEIEARIVQTNKNYARRLGVQWGFDGTVSPALGNTTPLAFPNNGAISGTAGGVGAGPNTAVNLGVQGATSAVGLQLGSINGAFNLDVALSALETSGNGRILSTPRVSTQNNVEAEITQGTQIPIQTIANNTVTVTFKDAALTLKVTPQITAAGTVIMRISLENGQADFTRAVNGIPPIDTQRANTQVLVKDGQTTVIGGIYTSTQQTATDRTPGISRIPLLGWLFRRDQVSDQNSELLIFITPRIIKG